MRPLAVFLAHCLIAGCAMVDVPDDRPRWCETWPHDPRDPRVGFYLYERSTNDQYGYGSWDLYRFDGDSITMLFNANYNLPPDCSYGHLREMPAGRSFQRFHAYVDAEDDLYALVPCEGWRWVGQFAEDRLWTPRFGVLRRVPPGDRSDLVLAPLYDERLVDEFFRCRPVWIHPEEPVPPRPAPNPSQEVLHVGRRG